MKKYIIAFTVLATVACKNNREPEIKQAPSQVQKVDTAPQDLNKTDSKEQVSFENEAFTKVYTAYLDLKAALVNTDVSTSKNALDAFLKTVENNDSFSNIMTATMPVIQESEVAEIRKGFENITAAVEAQIAQETITSGTIFKQYCPMAFDGKGAYWLSDSKEVRNPYFGDKMLKCGVVDKEIN
ncbi:DUF3347 domain-containing protein [Dokdonia sinensis]|uniref:DUF3347 domain-containing protein n=1 Tax=Dokdonia sinensis TaxID=2479847 RepID=A0A3M0FX87_9FLAO|nr:DUF3347 domain-containing protein [Dokdonia sinensis]RMB56557.1 DUF3347 domain-containing protein [Dokdonia sinensis]